MAVLRRHLLRRVGGGMIFPLLADLQDEHNLPDLGPRRDLGDVLRGRRQRPARAGALCRPGPHPPTAHDRRRALGGHDGDVRLSSELRQPSLARLLSGLAAGLFLPATRNARGRRRSGPATSSGATPAPRPAGLCSGRSSAPASTRCGGSRPRSSSSPWPSLGRDGHARPCRRPSQVAAAGGSRRRVGHDAGPWHVRRSSCCASGA